MEMEMSGTTILDLPTELLQHTFEYIDWDHSLHLTPFRPDIINISFTCRHLRKAVLPILFRNVSLKLRWVNGSLAEPGLLRLRQQCPELLKHTKCVHVDTHFGHFRDPRSSVRSFGVPKELQQWLESITAVPRSTSVSQDTDTLDHDAAARTKSLLETSPCRYLLQNAPQDVLSRFEKVTCALVKSLLEMPRAFTSSLSSVLPDGRDLIGDETYSAYSDDDDDGEARAESKKRIQNRTLRFKLDTFFVLLLCFPSRLTCVVFDSLPTDRMDGLQNQFALQFAALAFEIYGGQMKELTMRTTVSWTSTSRTSPNDRSHIQATTLSEVLPKLDAIEHLRLTAQGVEHSSRSSVQNLSHWHTIGDRITHLDLRNADGDPDAFINFIDKFTSLQQLTLGDISLWSQRPMPGAGPRAGRESRATAWLSFLIELRRKLPDVKFNIHDGKLGSKVPLSESGVHWVLTQAVPKGSTVSFERETRLMEDYESFFVLWSAEDSDRGQAAKEARRDGRLVDMALANRWRGMVPGKRG